MVPLSLVKRDEILWTRKGDTMANCCKTHPNANTPAAFLAPDTLPAFLTEREAATFLSQSVKTLQAQRWTGRGPAFHKLGRSVRYAREDLARYIAECRQDFASNAR